MDNVTPLRGKTINTPGYLPVIAAQYLAHLKQMGRAENTLISYENHLAQLVGYMAQRDVTQLQLVSSAHLQDFINALVTGNNNKPRTVECKMQAVQGLFNFAARQGIVGARNAMDGVDLPRWRREIVAAPEISELIKIIDAMPDTKPMHVRDRAIMALFATTALRVSALCALDIYNPTKPPRNTIYPTGRVTYTRKGGGIKETVMDDYAQPYLAAWLEKRRAFARPDDCAALFISRLGGRMTRQTVHARLKKIGAHYGIPDLHAHAFRHSRARHVVDTAGPRLAQYLLGHDRMSTTTDMYGEASAEKIRANLRDMSPLQKAG